MGCLQLVEGVHMPVATDIAINQSLSLKEEGLTLNWFLPSTYYPILCPLSSNQRPVSITLNKSDVLPIELESIMPWGTMGQFSERM